MTIGNVFFNDFLSIVGEKFFIDYLRIDTKRFRISVKWNLYMYILQQIEWINFRTVEDTRSQTLQVMRLISYSGDQKLLQIR
jgi:hypothetical protein